MGLSIDRIQINAKSCWKIKQIMTYVEMKEPFSIQFLIGCCEKLNTMRNKIRTINLIGQNIWLDQNYYESRLIKGDISNYLAITIKKEFSIWLISVQFFQIIFNFYLENQSFQLRNHDLHGNKERERKWKSWFL